MKFLRVEILFVRVKQCFVERSGRKDRTASRDYRGVARFSTTPSATHPAACRRSFTPTPPFPNNTTRSCVFTNSSPMPLFYLLFTNSTKCHCSILQQHQSSPWVGGSLFIVNLSVLGEKETLCHPSCRTAKMLQTLRLQSRHVNRRTFSSVADMVLEHTYTPGTKISHHPIDQPAVGISSIASFRAAAVGVVPSGEAYSNLNTRRLEKQGAKKAKKGKKTAITVVGEGMEWLDYDSFLSTVQEQLSNSKKVYVEDSRNLGDMTARAITSDATTALMLYDTTEPVPKSQQSSNFFNGGKHLTIYAAAEVKEATALIATEDGASKIILTGAAVCQTTLDAAIKAAVNSLAPPTEE